MKARNYLGVYLRGCSNTSLVRCFRDLFFACIMLFSIASTAYSFTETEGISVILQEEGGPARALHLYDNMTAIIIGTDTFKDLKGDAKQNASVRDAKAIEDVLRRKYPVGRFVTLYNDQATGDNIMKALEDDFSSAGLDDAILVYFAGTGISHSTASGDMGYIVPYDGSLKPDEMYKNISMQQLRDDLSALSAAKHVLFIMDVCPGVEFPGMLQVASESPRNNAHLTEITREPVRQVILSCGKNEKRASGGIFSDRLIEALNNKHGFFYASGLGLELQQKAAREKQHPKAGYIYGKGDFVFVPDPERLREEADTEISNIEADIKKLDALKEGILKNKKGGAKDLERKRALKEEELKQAQALSESAAREAELRKTISGDAELNPDEKARNKRERSERTAYLRQQADKMKRAIGGSATTFSMADAQSEIKRINELMERLEGGKGPAADLQAGAAIDRYRKTLSARKVRIMRQEFPLDDKGIKWKFIECNQEKEEFFLSAVVRDATLFSKSIVPKQKLADYCRKPDLLTVSAVTSLSEDASPRPPGLVLKGQDKDIFSVENLERSRFIHFNLMVLDTETNLIWAADDNPAGRKMTWYDAAKYVKQLNEQKYAGHNDWRLPTKEEFERLADYAKIRGIKKDIYKVFNEAGFKNVKSDMYWSSSESTISGNLAWIIYMWNGYMDRGNKATPNYVWPVRGGQ